MLPPDEYLVIRPLDALVQFTHDWGIERKTVLRVFMVVAIASMIVFTFMRASDPITASISTGLLSIVAVIVQLREERTSSSRGHNAVQMVIRTSFLGWVRFTIFMALFAPSMITNPMRNLDLVFWLLWLYSHATLKPIDKPKYHWRELFVPKTAPETA